MFFDDHVLGNYFVTPPPPPPPQPVFQACMEYVCLVCLYCNCYSSCVLCEYCMRVWHV